MTSQNSHQPQRSNRAVPTVDPAPDAGRPLVPRVLRLFRPYKFQVALVVLLVIATAGFGVINPVLVKFVFDNGLFPEGGPNMRVLWMLAGAMAIIAAANGILGVAQTYMTQRVGQYVMRDLRDAVYAHLQGMPLRFFTGTRTGEIQSRVTNDVTGVQQVVTATASDTLFNIVSLTSSVIAMVILSWQLTIVAVFTVPLYFFMAQWVGKRRRAVTSQASRSMAEVTAITQETLSISGIMLAKLFGRQYEETENFRRHNQELSDLTVRQQMMGNGFFSLVMAFLSFSPAAIYLLAGYMLSGSGPSFVTAGTIIAFTTLQSRMYFPVGRLLQVSVEIQSSMALFERIFGYLDLKQEITDSPNARPMRKSEVTGEITFDSVRVNYRQGPGGHPEDVELNSEFHPHPNPPPEGEGIGSRQDRLWALDGVNFRIPSGQMAAFVGPSGAGKTTIASLVPRLYDVTEGSVRIDGIDVREIRMADLSEIIGYVTQESYLFHATMERNLLYAHPDATCYEVVDAAKAAFIHDRIMEMPDGYNTVVGERGFRLSGGERQRLSIARVILHQPRILILDEATSSLDTESERYVQAALQPLMRGRTTMVIAHRLSTIMSADVIYVVDQGKIVESGNHAELLANNGLYARLYREQYDSGRIEAHFEDGVVYSDGTVAARAAKPAYSVPPAV